jgi:hypothetical protein
MLENEVLETPVNDEVEVKSQGQAELEQMTAKELGLSEQDYEEIIGRKKAQDAKKKAEAEAKKKPKAVKKPEDSTLKHTPEAKDDLDDLLKDVETETEVEETEDKTEESEETDEEVETENDDDLEELVHNGEVVKVSKEEKTILAQKGYDYTKKTQELSAEKKQFQAEKAETYKEVDKLLAQIEQEDVKRGQESERYKNFDLAIDLMKEEGNQEILDILAQYVSKAARLTKNPVVDSKVQGLQSRIDQLEQALKGQEHQGRLTGFYSGLAEFEKSETGKKLASIGLKIDKEAVKETWAASDKMTERQAVYAVHGEQIQHLLASKNKVQQSQQAKKTLNQVKTIGGSKGPSSKVVKKVDMSKMSSNDILDAIRLNPDSLMEYGK